MGTDLVTSNIATVCEGLKCEINAEIGVVPVVDIVPVSHKEIIVGFFLVLAVAWESDWSIKVEFDLFYPVEIAG